MKWKTHDWRLAASFLWERRRLLSLHILLALALCLFPLLLTAWAYFLRLPPMMVNIFVAMFLKPMVLFWLTVYMTLPASAFLAWSLPNMKLAGLPKRSIAFVCLLLAYNPLRIYYYWAIAEFERRHNYSFQSHDNIFLWDLRNLDTVILVGLAAWAIKKHRDTRPAERAVFHWLLFVCFLWAACDFFELFVFSFFLLEFALFFFDH